MLSKGTSGEWNFGPSLDEKHSVLDLVITFANSWGIDNEENAWTIEKTEQPHEAGYLLLDSSKARNLLGWTDKLSFSESIELTSDWFKQSRNLNPREITINQILKFSSLD
jgi:CDP-glucose 4,6-dehydratase